MKEKVIKDLVHGYIYINLILQNCIDTPYFQRLRRVKQLTCNLLFPSVNHTRYEHSLGVMKLATDYINQLKSQLITLGLSNLQIESLKEHLIFAALLHDIGHPPFSHLGEKFLDKKEILKQIAFIKGNKWTKKVFYEKEAIFGSPHEILSCYTIISKMISFLPNYIDLEFICRMIIGNKYKNNWSYNLCIDIINSSAIDVDKLDYLMRDNHMTGEIAPLIDIERLLTSISIDSNYKLCYVAKALPAIQSVVDSRDTLYLWVYHHHISIYSDFLLGEMISELIKDGIINKEDLFSPENIINNILGDDDIYSILRKNYIEHKNNKTDSYFYRLAKQFFERDFLKSVWKTIYEYHELQDKWIKDGVIPNYDFLNKLIENEEKIKNILDSIKKSANLKDGEVFLITKHHKFYHSIKKAPIDVYLNGEIKSLNQLLPQKNFEKFNDLSLYFYVTEKKKDLCYNLFLDELRKLNKHK